MFNFFKRSSTKSTNEIIAEIHNEFDSASERILEEAKSILKDKDTNKGDRLKALGFSNSKPVKETEEIQKKKTESQNLAQCVSYFKQWYPYNKFITEDAVKTICEKYGLVFGEVMYYKGDVPDKNLKEMETFVLRKEDMKKLSKMDYYQAQQMMAMAQSRRNRLFNMWEPEPIFHAYYEEEQNSEKEYTYTKPAFKICAPESDFDMRHLTRNGHKLELNIPDPIVLQPVAGGYLIVTKWGLEASDEIVKNEAMN